MLKTVYIAKIADDADVIEWAFDNMDAAQAWLDLCANHLNKKELLNRKMWVEVRQIPVGNGESVQCAWDAYVLDTVCVGDPDEMYLRGRDW